VAGNSLTQLLFRKIYEQLERTQHLVCLVPIGTLPWRPPFSGASFPLGMLLGHLLDCMAGLCAVLERAKPERLRHLRDLKSLPVNHSCSIEEARERIPVYVRAIEEGFAALEDAELLEMVPTVFVPEGEAVFTLLVGNLEHLINHKHQLFCYLKLLGVKLNTSDLYCLRGTAGSPPSPD